MTTDDSVKCRCENSGMKAKWAVFKIPGFAASVSFLSFPTATPSPLFHLRHFSRGLWLPFLVLCSLTARKRLLRRLGPVSTRMPLFSPKFKSTANFSAPAHEGNLFFLSGRSARKEIDNFPIKSSHLCRTSRHVWLSSSACDHCCAYQLICIMTISTYSTGARAEMTRQLGSCTVKNRVLACILVATGPGPRQIEVTSLHFVLWKESAEE